jgi:hypothetical protein
MRPKAGFRTVNCRYIPIAPKITALRSSPMVNFCSEKFLLCFVAAVLTFFIAGLLYLLCLKHVDNLGAYSIPSGDRPSHPICLQHLCSNHETNGLSSAAFLHLIDCFAIGSADLQNVLGSRWVSFDPEGVHRIHSGGMSSRNIGGP